jgi:hypothetical protein
VNHAAIAGVISLLLGERYAKPGRWPGRHVVGFGSAREVPFGRETRGTAELIDKLTFIRWSQEAMATS